ncbi:MAG: homoserine dehydrogenase [Bacteroidia bacterium]
MITETEINLGLFGYGVVGKGFYELTKLYPELAINTKEIVVKNHEHHLQNIEYHLSYEANDILQNNQLKTVVEVINNSNDALAIARQVLTSGNTLITANKRMLAENFAELYLLLKTKGGRLFYEGSSAASIPIIKILDEYFANENIQLIEGILNGTSNYILSGIFNNNLNYKQALKQAQELGFAETDPTLDIEGIDALNKLVIINAHAFGVIVNPNQVFNYGITHINEDDIAFAKTRGFVIKQVAHASVNIQGKLLLYVAPQFVNNSSQLFGVNQENNGILVNAEHSGQQFYFGKGAGSKPTGAAVLADVISSKQNKSYNYTKLKKTNFIKYEINQKVKVYFRYPISVNIEHLEIEKTKNYLIKDQLIIEGKICLSKLFKYKEWLNENEISIIVFP